MNLQLWSTRLNIRDSTFYIRHGKSPPRRNLLFSWDELADIMYVESFLPIINALFIKCLYSFPPYRETTCPVHRNAPGKIADCWILAEIHWPKRYWP